MKIRSISSHFVPDFKYWKIYLAAAPYAILCCGHQTMDLTEYCTSIDTVLDTLHWNCIAAITTILSITSQLSTGQQWPVLLSRPPPPAWLSGLGVWFSLRVREVPGSNPGWALQHSTRQVHLLVSPELRETVFEMENYIFILDKISMYSFINYGKLSQRRLLTTF